MPLVLSELPSCPGPSLPSLPSSCSAALTGLLPPFPRCWCSLEAELLPSGQLLGKCHPSLSQLHVPTHFILPRGSPIPLGTIPRGCGDPFSLPSCHRPQPWPLSEPTMSSLLGSNGLTAAGEPGTAALRLAACSEGRKPCSAWPALEKQPLPLLLCNCNWIRQSISAKTLGDLVHRKDCAVLS